MLDIFYREFGYGYVPQWHRDTVDIKALAEHYPQDTTAQLVRVYVHPGHRRRGLARTLVEAARDFIADTPGYDRMYLHTNVNIDGAESFWRSLAKEVFDARTTGEHGPGVATVHFEIPM